nr:complement C1q-like protein 4 isoform X2 [Crassostrea gigas]
MVLIGILLSLLLSVSDSLYIQSVQTFQYVGQKEKPLAVAFNAILSKDTTLGSKEVVKYDSVLTNVGGAYRPSTGIFTAPYKGIYTISCSLMSHPSNSVHLDIMKNGKKLSIVYSASGTNPHSAQTQQLLLNKGDRVWIQNRSGNKASLHDHGSYNLFSGALITKV